MDLKGKRALVTGGAVRIGRAICETLAARVCVVVVHYRTSGHEAKGLVDSLRAAGAEAFAVQAVLDSEAACARLVEESVELTGGLDILVNNAAVFHRDSLLDTTEATLRLEMQTNAFAPIFLTRAFAHLLPARAPSSPQGKVVNLLDRRVVGLERGALPYILSKKMLADFTELAALELAPGMTVNAVAPGPVLPPPDEGPERTRELAGSTPLGVPLTPKAVADAVVYLLEADAVTGQTICVDGGQHLGPG
jgi:pteridine reductase